MQPFVTQTLISMPPVTTTNPWRQVPCVQVTPIAFAPWEQDDMTLSQMQLSFEIEEGTVESLEELVASPDFDKAALCGVVDNATPLSSAIIDRYVDKAPARFCVFETLEFHLSCTGLERSRLTPAPKRSTAKLAYGSTLGEQVARTTP